MQTRASCLHAFFYHPVSKDGGTFQNRIAASESSAFSSHGKHRIPANAPNTPRTDRGIDIEPWSRPAFSCAPCNASQQSELPAELEASFAHTAIHQRLYARLDSVASAIFTDQRTEKAGESEKQLPGFVVLGFSLDLPPRPSTKKFCRQPNHGMIVPIVKAGYLVTTSQTLILRSEPSGPSTYKVTVHSPAFG